MVKPRMVEGGVMPEMYLDHQEPAAPSKMFTDDTGTKFELRREEPMEDESWFIPETGGESEGEESSQGPISKRTESAKEPSLLKENLELNTLSVSQSLPEGQQLLMEAMERTGQSNVKQLYMRWDENKQQSFILKKNASEPVEVEFRKETFQPLAIGNGAQVEELIESPQKVSRKDTRESEQGTEERDKVGPLPEVSVESLTKKNSLISNHLLQRNPLEIIGPLGRGGFGSVLKVKHLLDGQYYALKKIHLRVTGDI